MHRHEVVQLIESMVDRRIEQVLRRLAHRSPIYEDVADELSWGVLRWDAEDEQ